jgi:hypothetical protein
MAETTKQPARKSPAKKTTKKAAKKTAAKKGTARKRPAAKTAERSSDASSEENNGTRRTAATAESRPTRHRSSSDGSSDGPSDGARPKTSPMRIAAAALEQLAALTGRPSEGVVGIERDGEEWVVEIEVLELRRIPNTTDVLARYRVTADDSGDVTGYHRLQRYVRGAAGEE